MKRWLRRDFLAILLLLAILLITLALMSEATSNSARFGENYSTLLIASGVGFLLLTALIGRNLWQLARQVRSNEPGSRLTLRLMTLFVAISLAPVTVVYYFSVQFLSRSIDSWFDVRVERALEDALELSRTALDLRMREVLKQTLRIATQLADIGPAVTSITLSELREDSDAIELTLMDLNGIARVVDGAEATTLVPERPEEAVLSQVRQGRAWVNLMPTGDAGLQLRTLVRIPTVMRAGSNERILQALFPVADRFNTLGSSVQSAFDSYKELVFLRGPLKTSFILTLSLVLLLGILTALSAAVHSARRLVQPVRDLAEGTRAVAAGQYDKQLPQGPNDELGFLVQSFNDMTRRLAQARDSAAESQQQVEAQRTYLETVLARLSSGVLTLDHGGHPRTFNAAALQILGMDTTQPPADAHGAPLAHLLEAIAHHLAGEAAEWRQEVTLFVPGGRRVLMCRGSQLPDGVGLKGGHVLVFDDITTLVQAERDAAWAEVARRLAHEIKNPLTPIQLAAERIRHKYLSKLGAEDGRVLDRGTHTIVQQVAAMKDMVDAFNDYARAPQLRLTTIALNDFITDVLYLYRDYPAGVEIQLALDPAAPAIEADKGRLRQLLHNVVKNAIEAIRDGHGSLLRISTQLTHDGAELVFEDDGPGFPEGSNVFEPYVTTKPKGTGLGLAIVKKIVEEHGGLIRAENPPEGGARISIRFPLSPGADAHVPSVPPAVVPLVQPQEAG
ncbi:nitrogen fixation/metabolism regulation signal transduction histidine kinase [Plasticicumulans lactativorans]|uniref:histidine kinase n=1 Tax=Plasticicumulans lactativorans TaxID=1133106 RepID=A0A4R2L6E6_9GAMM|nr:ATP-binding protein [Plasticicumulans lactativorans]TCO81462.1 nitrogen fixation/metabolism regulation signal transduction histidine kinase [Plasticicumulans lactativorans]